MGSEMKFDEGKSVTCWWWWWWWWWWWLLMCCWRDRVIQPRSLHWVLIQLALS